MGDPYANSVRCGARDLSPWPDCPLVLRLPTACQAANGQHGVLRVLRRNVGSLLDRLLQRLHLWKRGHVPVPGIHLLPELRHPRKPLDGDAALQLVLGLLRYCHPVDRLHLRYRRRHYRQRALGELGEPSLLPHDWLHARPA
jgi:hypothetical protein